MPPNINGAKAQLQISVDPKSKALSNMLHFLLVYKNNFGQDLQLHEHNYFTLIPLKTH